MIRIKRVYEPPAKSDGRRFLVDRVWPRGKKKEELDLAGWIKDVAPSTALRKWFGHDPERWTEFLRRYTAELNANRETWKPLLAESRKHTITLLYGAHDQEHNNAVALQKYLNHLR